jgi:CheY-like chemotaxis protein/HPt (histidine-containing phosphotransfer) domain-containing protein
MSHEIRTPMNGVLGSAELLAREPLDNRQRRLVATIQSSAATLLRVIDDVLDFSKIEAGQMELEHAAFLLRALVDSAVDAFSIQAAGKGIDLVATVAPGTPDELIGDPTRIRQILLNLIGNAVKFTEAGCVRVSAGLVADGRPRAALLLEVADTGIGLTAEEQARLFQPFTQADSSTTRRFGGSGLGLSIVRRLANLMGGEVSVSSEPGQGSTFAATVAIEIAATEPTDAIAEPAVAAGPIRGGSPRRRVLLIDDYETNLDVVSEQLAILGIAADLARDGIEGLRLWRRHRHPLVLTDLHMPGIDGYALTCHIRDEEEQGAARTIIVALTANAVKGEADRCLAGGMDAYLTKPLTLARLEQTLAHWPSLEPRNAASAAVPAPPASLAPAIDGNAVFRAFGDNPATVRRLLARFHDSADLLVREIESEAAVDRLESLAEAGHKLKGAARAAGAVHLGDLAEALEREAHAGPSEQIGSLVGTLAAEWRRVAGELHAILQADEAAVARPT